VKRNFTTFGPFWKNLFGYPWKNSTIGFPGKNLSDTHVAAKGTIMRFVGSNIQVYYNNLP